MRYLRSKDVVRDDRNGAAAVRGKGGCARAGAALLFAALVEVHIAVRLSKLIEGYNRTASFPISYAVGWEVSYKNHYFLMDDLLRTADRNMYLDKSRKKQGRTSASAPALASDSRRTVPVIADDILAAKIPARCWTADVLTCC